VAEETDQEKCNFRNFRSSVTLILTLDRVEVTLVHLSGRGLPTHQIRPKLEKLFVDGWMDGCMYGETDRSSNLFHHHWRWPKIKNQSKQPQKYTLN